MQEAGVQAIYRNDVNTKNGLQDVYSLYIGGIDGKIGSGFDPEIRSTCRTIQKGDRVQVETKKNNKGYTEIKSIKKVHSQPNGNSQGNTQEDRQESIIRQSSMNYASQLVAAGMKKGDSMDHAAQEVIRIAQQYFVPYAKAELEQSFDEEAQEENNRTQDQQDGNPDDDIPF